MDCRASSRAGFTLIELMIVVAIIGILSSIAIPRYMTFQMKSKSVEAKSTLAGINAAEGAFFSEFGVYVEAGQTPASIPGQSPAAFAPVTSGFKELGYEPSGRVFFSYAIAVSADRTGYTAEATADLDADSAPQVWAYLLPDMGGSKVPATLGCTITNVALKAIAPCELDHGQSVF